MYPFGVYYGDEPSVFDLAADYVFLHSNGRRPKSSEAGTVNAVMALAAGEIDEPSFSNRMKNKSIIF